MIKKKRSPFIIALNNLDKDLKNIIKFNIKEQSLEISPFSLDDNESLKIFYVKNKVTFLYKLNFYHTDETNIKLLYKDDYNNQRNELEKGIKYNIFLEQQEEKNTSTFSMFMNDPRFVILNEEQKQNFEKDVIEKILSRKLRTFLNISGNVQFDIFNEEFKNTSSSNNLIEKLQKSKININDNSEIKQIITSSNKNIDIEYITKFYSNLSIKIEKIIKEFISYRVLKTMPKRFFNL